MWLVERECLDVGDAQRAVRDSHPRQRKVLGNGELFAIAGIGDQEFDRGRPVVLPLPNRIVGGEARAVEILVGELQAPRDGQGASLFYELKPSADAGRGLGAMLACYGLDQPVRCAFFRDRDRWRRWLSGTAGKQQYKEHEAEGGRAKASAGPG